MALLTVPIIEISSFIERGADGRRGVARAVAQACEEIGFFVIVGHGFDPRLADRVFEQSKTFFDLPLHEKSRAKPWTNEIPRGYSSVGDESVSYSRLNWTPGDLKESFTIGAPELPDDDYYRRPGSAEFYAENFWPERPAGFRESYIDYFRAMERLSGLLMRIFAVALALPEDYFADKTDRHPGALRVLNYPDQPEEPLPNQLRAGEHSDYGTFTIVRQENELRPGGLQVRNQAGDWVDVPVIRDSFVVNIGDMLMRWTNDRWMSTLHRVANPPRDRARDSRRMSIAFFHTTNFDTVVECLPSCCSAAAPPKYQPVTYADYLRERFVRQVTFAKHRAE
jgi:isopenicillin N synthase-like dioxygenase